MEKKHNLSDSVKAQYEEFKASVGKNNKPVDYTGCNKYDPEISALVNVMQNEQGYNILLKAAPLFEYLETEDDAELFDDIMSDIDDNIVDHAASHLWLRSMFEARHDYIQVCYVLSLYDIYKDKAKEMTGKIINVLYDKLHDKYTGDNYKSIEEKLNSINKKYEAFLKNTYPNYSTSKINEQ